MLSEKQKKVVNFATRKGRTLLSCGSVRSGKSYSCLLGALLYSQANSQGRENLIIGRNVDTLASAVIGPMQKIARGLGVDSHFRPHKSWLRIGRCEYHVRSGENNLSANAIAGLTIHTLLGEELTTLPQNFYEMATSRLTYDDSKMWGSTNPSGPAHWLKKEYVDENKIEEVFNFDITKDNPALSEETINWYKAQYSGIFFSRFIKGEWINNEGLIYPDFYQLHSNFYSPGDGGKFKHNTISCDVGNSSVTSLILGKVYSNNKVYIAAEKELKGRRGSGRTDDEICDAIVEMAEENGGIRAAILDSAASSTIASLKSHPERNFNVLRSRKKVLEGIRHTSSALKTKKIIISPECRELIKELESYCWNPATEQPDKASAGGAHYCDSIRYLAMSEIRRTINPGPIPLPAGL